MSSQPTMPGLDQAALTRLRSALDGRRAVITGGAGFIGGHLAEGLLSLGMNVCIVDDLSSGDGDRAATIVESHAPRARFVHASVLDARSLDDAMERAGIVFHLAAVASVGESMERPERTIDVNVRGTVEVCQAARAAGAKRVVLASSCAVYGDAGGERVREDAALAPISPYAASKAAGELIVGAWARSLGIDGVSLRLFNVYGPRQSGESEESAVVAAFASRLAAGRPPVIYGDGAQTRDFVYVGDVVRAMLLAAGAPEPFAGEAINIGSGRSTEIRALAEEMARAWGREGLAPEHGAARPGDIVRSGADPEQGARRLGFRATTPLGEGLRALAAWAGEASGAPGSAHTR